MAGVRETARELAALAREFVQRAREAQITFLAAAVAYYALVSLVPLLALALVVSATFGGEQLVEDQLDQFRSVLTPRTRMLLEEALVGGTGRVGASVVGTAVLLWSALKVLRALDRSFSEIYGQEAVPTLLRSVLDGVVVLGAVGLGVGAITVVLAVVRMLPLGPLGRTVAVLAGVATLTAVLLPVYVVFPNRHVSVRTAAPGALVAALGWIALGSLFSVYIGLAGTVALYGPLGGILLLVTLLYAGAVVVMVGAVLNVTIEGDRQVQQGGGRLSTIAGAMASDAPEDADATREESPRDDAADDAPASDASTDGEPTRDDRAGDAPASDDVTGDGGDTAGSSQRATASGAAARATEPDARASTPDAAEFEPTGRTSEERQLRAELEDVKAELEAFRADVEDRTVDREAVERDLRRYVRRRVRRGHARGWGPYLVLLYGTAMTIGAFYLLSSGWAILAMLVVWLSTLGLYVLMVLVGFGLNLLGLPGRVRDAVGDWRS